MDKKLQDYYENRFAMTATPGWSDLDEDIGHMIKAVSDIRNVTEKISVEFRKGQLDILLWLRNLRNSAEAGYEQLKEQDRDDPSV